MNGESNSNSFHVFHTTQTSESSQSIMGMILPSVLLPVTEGHSELSVTRLRHFWLVLPHTPGAVPVQCAQPERPKTTRGSQIRGHTGGSGHSARRGRPTGCAAKCQQWPPPIRPCHTKTVLEIKSCSWPALSPNQLPLSPQTCRVVPAQGHCPCCVFFLKRSPRLFRGFLCHFMCVSAELLPFRHLVTTSCKRAPRCPSSLSTEGSAIRTILSILFTCLLWSSRPGSKRCEGCGPADFLPPHCEHQAERLQRAPRSYWLKEQIRQGQDESNGDGSFFPLTLEWETKMNTVTRV